MALEQNVYTSTFVVNADMRRCLDADAAYVTAPVENGIPGSPSSPVPP